MDVKTSFLNDNLEEDVYIDQPLGFIEEEKEHMLCKLKSIYGLKQTSQRFNDIIVSFEFKKNNVDQYISEG